MFLSDPALRVIAATTGDVWPEHRWHHGTAASDPLGDLARLLHQITLRYNDNTELLDQALPRLQEQAGACLRELRNHGTDTPARFHGLITDILSLLERRVVLADLLLASYAAWRRHAPIGLPAVRHLLLCPGDPTFGVATLRHLKEGTWQVIPDSEAAASFAIPYTDCVIGEVSACDTGWKPTAYTHPEQREQPSATAFPLPTQLDLTVACRTLLRWWQLWHCAAGGDLTPAQLSAAELDALSR